MQQLTGLASLLAACPAFAAEQLPAPALGTGNVLQMLIGLSAVLALVFTMGWVLKKISGHHFTSHSAIRVVAGTAVGQRERVVVVEVADTWLVLGVASGHVSALHTMPRAELPLAHPAAANTGTPFGLWLARMLEKKHAQ